jgi:ribonuclease VapC
VILDTSAILAILLREQGWRALSDKIASAEIVGVGAPTLAEAAIVLSSRVGRDATPLIARFLREAEAELIPFSCEHYEVARDAFLRFGKGRHPAALNFGDCLTYAVARLAGLPLLFTGRDFSKTDILSG